MDSDLSELVQVGSLVAFDDEDLVFEVIAKDEKFAVCTNNDLGPTTDDTVYTIIDLKENIRGPHNIVFNSYDFTDVEDMNQMINDLNDSNNTIEISHRNRVELKVRWFTRKTKKESVNNE
ncbi:hypothetical protein [Senegalia massiliensis]|uniref:hypothetical protein n=1 Tax=Senegalia massiliensis TaxID=1720316 RepID=UPI00102F3EFE|nr:hypothetical protein [Senegalia massiliensis]